jgi:hypothetical protein
MLTVTDIIKEQDELKAHTLDITLWPKRWKAFVQPHPLAWTILRLEKPQQTSVPKSAGIYTILVQPGIAGHPSCSFLLYVGKSKNLYVRFGQYLTTERRVVGRPKVFRMLNTYSDYAWFCFTPVPQAQIGMVEDVLIGAYIPHCNDDFPADLRPVVGAFK